MTAQGEGSTLDTDGRSEQINEETLMQLGMIGLGRMGANIVRRLMRKGHECVVYNRTPQPVEALASEGATGVRSVQELAAKLTPPRVVGDGAGRGDHHLRHYRAG